MPPLRQYLSRLLKKCESIAAPKGHGPRTPAAFPLQTGHFKGPPEGAMIAVVDPPASRRREWWAKAMPPLWKYFASVAKKRGELIKLFAEQAAAAERLPA
jgi:hypothetical protein